MAEEGEAFLLKPIPHANAQQCAKSEEQKEKAREAAREVLAEMKRKREEREAKHAEGLVPVRPALAPTGTEGGAAVTDGIPF